MGLEELRGEEPPPEEGAVKIEAEPAGAPAEGAPGIPDESDLSPADELPEEQPDAATAPSTSISAPPPGRVKDRPEPET
eukprot:9019255-Pyramimonas_sp.AAC.1